MKITDNINNIIKKATMLVCAPLCNILGIGSGKGEQGGHQEHVCVCAWRGYFLFIMSKGPEFGKDIADCKYYQIHWHQPKLGLVCFKTKAGLSECNLSKALQKVRGLLGLVGTLRGGFVHFR